MTEQKKSRIEMSVDAAKARDGKLRDRIKGRIVSLEGRIEKDKVTREELLNNLRALNGEQ